jgi:hypothetical protein
MAQLVGVVDAAEELNNLLNPLVNEVIADRGFISSLKWEIAQEEDNSASKKDTDPVRSEKSDPSSAVTVKINKTQARRPEVKVTYFPGLALHIIVQYMAFQQRLAFSGLNKNALYYTRHFALHSSLHVRLNQHLESTARPLFIKAEALNSFEERKKAQTILDNVILSPATMQEIDDLQYKTSVNVEVINAERNKNDTLANFIIRNDDPLYLLIHDAENKDWQLERYINKNLRPTNIKLEAVEGLNEAIRNNDEVEIKEAIVTYENPLVKTIESHRAWFEDLYSTFYLNDNDAEEMIDNNIAISSPVKVTCYDRFKSALMLAVALMFFGFLFIASILAVARFISKRYFPSAEFSVLAYLAIIGAVTGIFSFLGGLIGAVCTLALFNRSEKAKNKRQLKRMNTYKRELLAIVKGEKSAHPFNADQVINDSFPPGTFSGKQDNINAFLRAYAYDIAEREVWVNRYAKGYYEYLPFNGQELIRPLSYDGHDALSFLLEKQYSRFIFEYELRSAYFQKEEQDPLSFKAKNNAAWKGPFDELLMTVPGDVVMNKVHQRVILLLAKHYESIAQYFAEKVAIKHEHSDLITGLAYHSEQARTILGRRLGGMQCDRALSAEDAVIAAKLFSKIASTVKGKQRLSDKVGYYRGFNDNVFFKQVDVLNDSGYSNYSSKLAM